MKEHHEVDSTRPADEGVADSAPGIVSGDLISPGQVLGGRYRVLSVLGCGGMGVVYRVEQIFLSRQFALKTLAVNNASPPVVRRFQAEARACSNLDHPNLVKVHDFGLLDNDTPFFVMDLIEGQSLAQILRQRGSLSLEEALPIFMEACFGLSYAHENGVVHRDIKPSNILIGKDIEGSLDVKIVDFGIAKITQSEAGEMQALTRTGEIFGSPYYMSPEQCLGTAIDHRTDIYSMGCVIFETLTGAPPFIGDSALATMMKHQSEPAATLQEASLGREFPAALEQIVKRMLAKVPDERFERVSGVARALMQLDAGSAEPTAASARRSKNERRAPEDKYIGEVQKLPRTVTLTVPALMVLALVLAAISFACGMFVHHLFLQAKTKMSISEKNTEATRLEKSAIIPSPTIPAGRVRSEIILSGDGKKYRKFVFPGDQVYGAIYDINSQFSKDARGEQVFPINTRIALRLLPLAIQSKPDFLEDLQADDLDAILLPPKQPQTLADEDFNLKFGHLTGLRRVEFSNNYTVGDSVVPELNKLPHLKILAIDDTAITSRGASQLTCLNDLTTFICSNITEHGELLKRLSACPDLFSLHMRKCNLTEDDLAVIAAMPKLQELMISKNPDITDKGLRHLSHLKLSRVNLKETPVTPASIPLLAGLKTLRTVEVPQTWSAEDAQRLEIRLKSACHSSHPVQVKIARAKEPEY